MTKEQLEQLETALRRHARLLKKLLVDPQRAEHDHYLPLAGQLRVLLCDRDVPILIAYADARGIPLNIAPVVSDEFLPPAKGIKVYMTFATYSWPTADDTRSVGTIQQLLDKRIGATSIGT